MTTSSKAAQQTEAPDELEEQESTPASFDAMVGAESGPTTRSLVATEDEATGLVGAAKAYTDSPDFDPEDLAMPRLRLAQGLTAEVQEGTAKPGQWVLVGHDPVNEVLIVPLRYSKNRTFREDKDGPIACQSGDAKVGVGDNGQGMGSHSCRACPQAQWGEKDPKTGKGTPPQCRLQYSYICWSLTHDTLVELNLAGTATGSATWINTMIGSNGLGRFSVRLAANGKKNARGQSFYEPSPSPHSASPEELEMARSAVNL